MKKQADLKNKPAAEKTEALSLNDDRRVKVLSPTALVLKRFFRNTLSVVGLVMIVVMFLFSFLGGFLIPYDEDEIFYTYTDMKKNFVTAEVNDRYRYLTTNSQTYDHDAFEKTLNDSKDRYRSGGMEYEIQTLGTDLYLIRSNNADVAIEYKEALNALDTSQKFSFDMTKAALTAHAEKSPRFSADGSDYTIDADGVVFENNTPIAVVSRFIVTSKENGRQIPLGFRNELQKAVENKETELHYQDENGTEYDYSLEYKPANNNWDVKQGKSTYVKDTYSKPSKAHPLGTDSNGMDMLTRLMYGGRVSLVIGFIVVFIAAFLGVLFGGISGYFGGWVDNLIMRIVDIFYCIPSMPLIIILGAAMDAMQIEPKIRMLYLMLILGFLSWPGIARLIRGQILSLREQEFMTATEACGISVHRRIFQHLIPNVIPQLIVICTMDLGSTILTEATLSFLGLGVKFPFASWGNIINDVNNSFVMENYWFIWIPAGFCLLISVLGFNFIGDGLRDAFDPKMKR
ncbi:MAG: ABC transporter permease [Clostridia bacterium]|nr:ABC transporter permease [Clostridia bacterium]